MTKPDALLVLARRVAEEAEACGVKVALIGALALAHHGYVRATVDVDFAAYTDFDTSLRALAERLRALGLVVDLRAPDEDDPLGGLLRVRESTDGDPVDIVNFRGPKSPGALAIARAERAPDGFSYARVPELVALKLYAGSRFDLDDAARLLSEVGDVDLDEVRRVCAEADQDQSFERLRRRMEED